MGKVTSITITIDKIDLRDIDALVEHPRCRFRNRSSFIGDLIKKSLPETKKELEDDL